MSRKSRKESTKTRANCCYCTKGFDDGYGLATLACQKSFRVAQTITGSYWPLTNELIGGGRFTMSTRKDAAKAS